MNGLGLVVAPGVADGPEMAFLSQANSRGAPVSDSESLATSGVPKSMASPSIAALAAALAKAQGEIADAVRDSDNPFFRSSYADLASVWRACRKALTTNDLAVIQTTGYDADRLILRTTLAHSSGEWIAGVYPVRPMKQEKDIGWVPSDDPQSHGSALTYARRYALAAIVGVAPAGDDDDAEVAMQRGPEERDLRIPWGNAKGMLVAELPAKEVEFYFKAYTRDVSDPDKARYKKFNQRVLDALALLRDKREVNQEPPFGYQGEEPQAAPKKKRSTETVQAPLLSSAATSAERDALMLKVRKLGQAIGLTDEQKRTTWTTYLGDATDQTADPAALQDLIKFLETRAQQRGVSA